MRKLALGVVGVVLAASTIAAARMGGWAVVSVRNAPDHFIVDKPVTLEFIVRQHGGTPLDGLSPSVKAWKGIRWVNGKVVPTPAAGVYRATLTIPSTGEWTVSIASGFGPAKGRMLAKRAIAPDERAPAITQVERGRQTFASAGCATCHYHNAVGLKPVWDFAPDLTDKRFAPDYLAKYLADPTIKPKPPNGAQMPNPGLAQTEIASLIAFINDERKVAAK